MNRDQEREYGDFVAARADQLCRFAYLLCGDWHRAEDAVQTGFTRLYVAWGRLRDQSGMEPYLRRIIVRAVLDQRRLGWFRRESTPGQMPERAAPADEATDAVDRITVLAALRAVPPRQRAVLILRYWEDQSIEQTAELLGCSVGTVKSQAARGLTTLREQLHGMRPGHDGTPTAQLRTDTITYASGERP